MSTAKLVPGQVALRAAIEFQEGGADGSRLVARHESLLLAAQRIAITGALGINPRLQTSRLRFRRCCSELCTSHHELVKILDPAVAAELVAVATEREELGVFRAGAEEPPRFLVIRSRRPQCVQ